MPSSGCVADVDSTNVVVFGKLDHTLNDDMGMLTPVITAADMALAKVAEPMTPGIIRPAVLLPNEAYTATASNFCTHVQYKPAVRASLEPPPPLSAELTCVIEPVAKGVDVKSIRVPGRLKPAVVT